MKKLIVVIFLFTAVLFYGWGQDKFFELPQVTADVESVQLAFSALLDNIIMLGGIDYDSSWADNYTRYQWYLDGVLKNMNYQNIKNYVEKINSEMQKIDFGEISKRRKDDFETFMTHGTGTRLLFSDTFPDILRNFNTWLAFFNNENATLKVYLIADRKMEKLAGMLDNIQQKNFKTYQSNLNKFIVDWGL